MSTMFYRVFEERHRGSCELIKSRLEIYLPFVRPLKTLGRTQLALDLGCGRGEWMELLQDIGFQVKGVDLDEGMLEACQKRGLDVTLCDAIEYIKTQPNESLDVISAFHFVEHIPFDVLRLLVDEAHRVLKPGGLLILETPNSENLLVGTSSFYLDPTHQRPIPADLLSFVVEYATFNRVKIMFLQEPASLATTQQIGLHELLAGVSPDYAIVAQKKADPKICALFDVPFEKEYGTHLMTLVQRYDHQVKINMQRFKNNQDKTQHKIDELCQRIYHLETSLLIAQQTVEKMSLALNEARRKTMSQPVDTFEATGLLRHQQIEKSSIVLLSMRSLRRIIQRLSKTIKNSLRSLRNKIAQKAFSQLKMRLSPILMKYPRIKERLRRFATRFGYSINAVAKNNIRLLNKAEISAGAISPRAASIYTALQKASHKKGEMNAHSD